MNYKFSFKTHIHISFLASFLYILIASKQTQVAHAQAILTTDCSTDLDQADTIYQLTTNVVGNCTVTADNITIDGLDLYEIGGNIEASERTDITVQNVVSVGNIYMNSTNNAGVLDVLDTTVTGNVLARGAYGIGGTINIDTSEVSGYVYASSNSFIQNGGIVNLTNSSAGLVLAYGYLGGTITFDNSHSGAIFNSGTSTADGDGIGGTVVLENGSSATTIYVFGNTGGTVSLNDSSADAIDAFAEASNGSGGSITLENNSVVTGNIDANGFSSYSNSQGNGGSITISDSTFATLYANGGDINGAGVAGNGGNISIIGSTITSPIYADGGQGTIANSTSGNGGSVIIEDSTINANIFINGGDSAFFIGGNGGSATITNSVILNTSPIQANGGDLTSSYVGNSTSGDGGIIIITDTHVSEIAELEAYAGSVADNGTQGEVGTLTITDNAPIITAPDISLEFDEEFLEDATAIDIKDGDLTEDIEITGEVLAEAGEYELEYSVSDSGTTVTFNGTPITSTPATNTTILSRLITRLADDTPAPRRSGSSGGGSRPTTPAPTTPTTLPTTVEGLQALLAQLQTQLATLLANTPASNNNPFTRDLYSGIEGEDVKQLQILLNSKGFTINTVPNPGAPGYESTYFGNKTQDALIKYQQANNIQPASGYFGPVTRSKMNQ